MYLQRHIEDILKKAEKQTKVILLTGARQVGKSTSIREIFKDYEYITLDDENELRLALTDRTLFFKDRKFPMIIDEVQYAKELMRAIKWVCDKSEKKGQIFITGSQTYELLSTAAESLAGRISILEMSGLSCRERFCVPFHDAVLPTEEYIREREQHLVPYTDLWEHIHRGSMPELLDAERDWEWFYRDYIRTYIERDVRKIINIKDEMKFRSFLVSIAARSGQILIYEDIAKDIEVNTKTVKHWISVVAASGLIKMIYPYHNNAIKRAVKAPKLYFMDTGLLCYFVGWKTAETAKNGAMSGSIFETFVVSELIKSYMNAGKSTDQIFYYRDKDKKEIDLLLEEENVLYPIEIKKGATASRDWIRHFSVLDKIAGKKIGTGAVFCQMEKKTAITETVSALPVEYL